ncbi:hypothetical protein BDZ89DRAFT_1050372 [Hymenopellis radicata]|nr:hypothetical protein BDZ89DRAFT_1050372 [Hymenopellis radicata]
MCVLSQASYSELARLSRITLEIRDMVVALAWTRAVISVARVQDRGTRHQDLTDMGSDTSLLARHAWRRLMGSVRCVPVDTVSPSPAARRMSLDAPRDESEPHARERHQTLPPLSIFKAQDMTSIFDPNREWSDDSVSPGRHAVRQRERTDRKRGEKDKVTFSKPEEGCAADGTGNDVEAVSPRLPPALFPTILVLSLLPLPFLPTSARTDAALSAACPHPEPAHFHSLVSASPSRSPARSAGWLTKRSHGNLWVRPWGLDGRSTEFNGDEEGDAMAASNVEYEYEYELGLTTDVEGSGRKLPTLMEFEPRCALNTLAPRNAKGCLESRAMSSEHVNPELSTTWKSNVILKNFASCSLSVRVHIPFGSTRAWSVRTVLTFRSVLQTLRVEKVASELHLESFEYLCLEIRFASFINFQPLLMLPAIQGKV